MEAILNCLSNPHKTYPSIHVAGTNGKGSVCAFLAGILQEQGYQVGLYTSPHLVDLNERFAINQNHISDNELCELILFIKDFVEKGFDLSYFEYTTAIAMEWFKRKKIDIAIFETGLGGRLDATNVITPEVSVITNIAFDHQSYLGNTLAEIAIEKAGIIKNNRPVALGNIHGEALQVIREKVNECQSPCMELGRDFKFISKPNGRMDFYGNLFELHELKPALYGIHQHENCAIAIAAIDELSKNSSLGMNISEAAISTGVQKANWNCRCEFLKNETGQVVLLDGAHNEDGIRVLCDALKDRLQGFSGIKGLLFACSAEGDDKDYVAMFKHLQPFFDIHALTEPIGPRKPVTVTMWQSKPDITDKIHTEQDWGQALAWILDKIGEQGFACASGSLYMIGHARKALLASGFKPFDPT